MLVVESAAHARARGAAADVEVAGCGLSGDAVHMTAPARDGAGAARAMRAALRDASARAASRSTSSARTAPARSTTTRWRWPRSRAVFGEAAPRLPVNSIKGAIGHTLGAAGSFEAIMCARVLRAGRDPADGRMRAARPGVRPRRRARRPRAQPVRIALSTSSAFAGNNAAIVLRRDVRTAGRRAGASRVLRRMSATRAVDHRPRRRLAARPLGARAGAPLRAGERAASGPDGGVLIEPPPARRRARRQARPHRPARPHLPALPRRVVSAPSTTPRSRSRRTTPSASACPSAPASAACSATPSSTTRSSSRGRPRPARASSPTRSRAPPPARSRSRSASTAPTSRRTWVWPPGWARSATAAISIRRWARPTSCWRAAPTRTDRRWCGRCATCGC